MSFGENTCVCLGFKGCNIDDGECSILDVLPFEKRGL